MEFFPTLESLFHLATTIPATGRRNVAVFFAGARWHLAEEASRKTDIGNAVLGPVAGPYVSQRHWHWVGGGWGGDGVFDLFLKTQGVLPVLPYNPPVRC